MSNGVVFLISRTNGFNVRLAVALYTLRKGEPELPVVILHSENDVAMPELMAIANTFNCCLKSIGEVSQRRRKSLLLKTRVNEWLENKGPWLYCDADIHFEASPRPLFACAIEYGFVVTQMCNWTIGCGKIAGRIRPWNEHRILPTFPASSPAVNSGIFSWVNTHKVADEIWGEWHDATERGIEIFGGGHCVDEYPLNLLALGHGAYVVGSEWNAYGKYHPDHTRVKIYHHAGAKHFRKDWWDGEKARYPSSQRWCMYFDELRAKHPHLVCALTVDKHTREYMDLKDKP